MAASGQTQLFIYLVSKLLEKSFELTIVELFKKVASSIAVAVPEMNPITDIFLRTSQRQSQLISFALFEMNHGEILRDDCSRILF